MSEIIIHGRRIDIARVMLPWRLNILLDVSGSMDGAPLATAKKGIETFLANVARRNHPGDWATASCFSGYVNTKGERLYYWTMDSYCRMDSMGSVRALSAFVSRWHAVWHGTALYDAIVEASRDLLAHVRRLGTHAIDVVIAVTDGEDNGSQRDPQSIGYPNDNLSLGLIGVGRNALSELRRLEGQATSTHHIRDFGDLYGAMFATLGVVIERRFGLRVVGG